MFQWEHVYVMREMRRLLIAAHPWLEPYVRISCERGPVADRRCQYQGWESVDEQCDFEWGREDNRSYRPAKELRIEKEGAS
jgi:hypothetical protein